MCFALVSRPSDAKVLELRYFQDHSLVAWGQGCTTKMLSAPVGGRGSKVRRSFPNEWERGGNNGGGDFDMNCSQLERGV